MENSNVKSKRHEKFTYIYIKCYQDTACKKTEPTDESIFKVSWNPPKNNRRLSTLEKHKLIFLDTHSIKIVIRYSWYAIFQFYKKKKRNCDLGNHLWKSQKVFESPSLIWRERISEKKKTVPLNHTCNIYIWNKRIWNEVSDKFSRSSTVWGLKWLLQIKYILTFENIKRTPPSVYS